jgi:hypothetical protein
VRNIDSKNRPSGTCESHDPKIVVPGMPLNQPSELGGGQFARRVPATQLNEPIGVSDEPTIERVGAGGAILLEPFSALVDQRVPPRGYRGSLLTAPS